MDQFHSNPEIAYWIAFSELNGFSPLNFEKIRKYFPTLQKGWEASFDELQAAGVSERSSLTLLKKRNTCNPDKVVEVCKKNDIHVLLSDDPEYPTILKTIPDYPFLLYYRGTLPKADAWRALTVVGSRKASSYGRAVLELLLPPLIQAGIQIVSGLAYGIDSYAHTLCLKYQGTTVSIIGSGLDREYLYPRLHWELAEKIIQQGGALISEYPPGTQAQVFHFPQRNRILAGLSQALAVIEADEKSGTLITARCALDYNRDVAAVPGAITHHLSRGTNSLLKQGAQLVTCADDLLNLFSFYETKKHIQKVKEKPLLSEQEEKIFRVLSKDSLHINDIHSQTGVPLPELNSILMVFEMGGLVKNCGNMYYVKNI